MHIKNKIIALLLVLALVGCSNQTYDNSQNIGKAVTSDVILNTSISEQYEQAQSSLGDVDISEQVISALPSYKETDIPMVSALYIDYEEDDYYLIAAIEDESEIDIKSIDLRLDGRQICSYSLYIVKEDFGYRVVLKYPLGILGSLGDHELSLSVADIYGNSGNEPIKVIRVIEGR